ncbi:Sensor histidine kinase YpdA [compost metagenome]
MYKEIRQKLEFSNGELIWMRKSLPSSIEPSGYRDVIIASRWMWDYNYDNNVGMYGMLVMVIDEDTISQAFKDIAGGEKGRIYLFDQRLDLLYTDDASGWTPDIARYAELKSDNSLEQVAGDSYYFAMNKSPQFSFTLISRVSLTDIFHKSRQIFNISLYSGLVGIMLSGILIFLLSYRLLRPLNELIPAMRSMREGNFDTRIQPRTNDELGYIAESFNSMASNVNSLINEVYLRQLSEREAELKAIQAQLNPHFLYNTLNGLYWKLYLQNDLDTANLISSLSDMMKYSLERVDRRTTVQQELDQIRHYLELQSAFMEHDFKADIQAVEEVLACQVPRLLLQPLVENVFVHAFRDQRTLKKLDIRVYVSGVFLRIEVEDNGCGLNELQMAGILSAEPKGDRENIGIRSVIRRIDLIYGQPFRLEIGSVVGEGTTVHLFLPLDSMKLDA